MIRYIAAGALVCACLGQARAAEYAIHAVRFEGNDRTRASTLIQELTFHAGESVSDRDIERSRQAIMDLGLFKTVKSQVEPVAGQYDVVYKVQEKHYWYLVPRIGRSGDGDSSYGAKLNFDNLRGRNQNLQVTYRDKSYNNTDVTNERLFEVELNSPRVFGSPWETNFQLQLEKSGLDEERDGASGQYQLNYNRLDFRLGRWLRETGPSRGWRVTGGLRWERYDYTYLSGDPTLFFDADIVSLVGAVEYRDVSDLLYARRGRRYGYDLQLSTDALGSDVSFMRHSIFYRRYLPVTSRPYTNLNYQLRAGYASRSIFGDPVYNLAGDQVVRGYQRDSIEGNAYLIANVEFLTPIFGQRSLRGALFMDIGNAYPTVHDVDPTDLKTGVGFGLRWRIKSFVNVDLRLDFAHGVNGGGDNEVYAATRATF